MIKSFHLCVITLFHFMEFNHIKTVKPFKKESMQTRHPCQLPACITTCSFSAWSQFWIIGKNQRYRYLQNRGNIQVNTMKSEYMHITMKLRCLLTETFVFYFPQQLDNLFSASVSLCISSLRLPWNWKLTEPNTQSVSHCLIWQKCWNLAWNMQGQVIWGHID